MEPNLSADVAVVGAGPAGLTAAVTLAERGLRVAVVDEQSRPGGQVFRRPPAGLTSSPFPAPPAYPWGPALVRRAALPGITWHLRTTALGVLHGDDAREPLRLVTSGPGGTRTLHAKRLVVATGAYDMPVPLPGWTLPGVWTAGAVQTLLKGQRLLLAQRLVLAGSHPLLLVVADQLRRSGAEVVEVAFARGLPRPTEAVRALGAVPGHLHLLADAARAAAGLVAAGTRISPHTVVSAARGSDRVASVELTAVDRDWRPAGRPRRVDTEALVLGYGFHPSTELARQARCAMRWDSPAGGWVVAHGPTMATSVPGVYVAGEPAGVGGAETARAQGRLAGLAIARDLTGVRDGAEWRRADAALRRALRFATVVQSLFEPNRSALLDLADGATDLCRCELVRRGQLERLLADTPWVSSANAVKLESRCGMGPCQGRYCEASVGALIARRRGIAVDEAGHFAAQFPVKPVSLGTLADLGE